MRIGRLLRRGRCRRPRKNTILLREPSPCNFAVESCLPRPDLVLRKLVSSSPEECFFDGHRWH